MPHKREKKLCLRLIVLMVFICVSPISLAVVHNNILLTFDEVNALAGQDGVVLVDARPTMQFKKLHIKGAVSLPTNQTYVKSGRSNIVASVLQVRELINNAGIKAGSHVIVYGDKNFLDTTRLFWVLEAFGIEKVSIMNGRLTEWKKLNYATESGLQEVEKSDIIPQLSEDKLARMLSVFAAIKDEEQVLMDVRSKLEYEGVQSQTGVYGHIPSATNIPWKDNLTVDYKKFRTADELKALYAGIDPDKSITVYCNKGSEFGVSYVALRTMRSNVRAYDGSWFEWSLNTGLPIINKNK